MNKRFWMAFAACFVISQIVGFVTHGVLLQPTYEAMAQVWRPKAEMDSLMWIMMLSAAFTMFLFCYIFTKNYENKGIAEGLRYGLLIGLLMSTAQSLGNYVVYPVPFWLACSWFAAGMVTFVISGMVLAAIYRRDA